MLRRKLSAAVSSLPILDHDTSAHYTYRSLGFSPTASDEAVLTIPLAERVGFEPTVPFWSTHALQACRFNQLSHLSAPCTTLSTRAKMPALAVFGPREWRRERDSNPRGTLWAPNRFRVDRLRPLGHPSLPVKTTIWDDDAGGLSDDHHSGGQKLPQCRPIVTAHRPSSDTSKKPRQPSPCGYTSGSWDNAPRRS